MNNVIIMGNLVKDIDLKSQPTKAGTEFNVAKFTLAVPREYLNKDGTRPADFIDFMAYDVGSFKLATNISKYFKKGDKILVKGRIEIGEYVNANKVKVRKTFVKVEGFDFCQKKNVQIEGENVNPNQDIEYEKWYDVQQEAE